MTKPATATLLLSLVLSSAALAADGARKLDFANDKVYDHVIKPIFASTCYKCHGEEKDKGDLRLHTPEAIKMGGENGDAVIPGSIKDSLLIELISLPEDDDDVMPPEGKKQLTAEQKKLLGWWIEQGAVFDKKISEVMVPEDIKLILAATDYSEVASTPEKVAGPQQPAAAAPAAVKAIEDAGVLIMPLAQDTTFLVANAINVAKEFNDGNVKALGAVAPQLQWLDISKTQVTDASAADLAKLQTLTRLHLENTGVTDASLAGVGQLVNLEYLNLYGTKVTDAGLEALKGLTNLKKIYLWQTGVTDAGAEKLKAAIPGVDVNMGWKEPAAPAAEPAAPAAPAAEPAK